MYIYKITNIIDGKFYIGKTELTIEKRFKEHIKDAFKNNSKYHLHNAIRLYGLDNFIIEQVCKCKNTNVLNKMEKHLIDKLNPNLDKNIGYNMMKGGRGGAQGEEGRRKISEAAKGNTHWLNKNHKESSKEIMRKKMLGNDNGKHRKNFVKIALINDKGEILKRYDTVKEAAKDNGIKSPGDISSFCRGGQKSFKNGSRFKYIGKIYKTKRKRDFTR